MVRDTLGPRQVGPSWTKSWLSAWSRLFPNGSTEGGLMGYTTANPYHFSLRMEVRWTIVADSGANFVKCIDLYDILFMKHLH